MPLSLDASRLARSRARAEGLAWGLAFASLTLSGCQRIPNEVFDTTDGFMETDGDGDPIDPGPGDPVFNCVPGAEDDGCGAGQKCTVTEKGGHRNVFECVEDSPEHGEFEACTVAKNGVDGCVQGSACVADFTEAGICVPLCQDNGDCDRQGKCIQDPIDQIRYCADECLPFASNCPSRLQCRQLNDRTLCQFSLENDNGFAGEECAFRIGDRGCAAGFSCLDGALVTGCQHMRCCARYCDTRGDGSECVSPDSCNEALHNPAPTFDTVGACYVPQQ